MQLDFIENVNEYGESVVRLYDFDMAHAIKFKMLIEEVVINRKEKLNLAEIEFIEPRNCNLILGIFKDDEGILSADNEIFYCMLTQKGYEEMLNKLVPFCEKETKGYQYLYDLDNPIDFLFSPAGTW